MCLRFPFIRFFTFYILMTAGILPMAQAGAQTPKGQIPAVTPPAPAADPAQEAAKRAFESLPETGRIAIQDGLIWAGDYKGIADGKFGKGTRDAIVAFAGRNKLPTDGTLDPKGRSILAALTKQAKDSVHFLVQPDEKTGLRIGLPLKLLTKVKPLASGTRYSSADESFSIETSTRPATATSLQDTFATLIADQPGRKVTYKILRPDFFVVAGDMGTNTFYTRMARGEHAGAATLNGFTITYPIAAKSRFDPLSIAIANSFVPFPDGAAEAAASVSNAAGVNPEAAVAKSALTATGIAIAPGLVLTSLPKTCGDPRIGTKKAKILKHEDMHGLTLLLLPDAPAANLPVSANDPADSSQAVILSFASRANAADELIGAAGELHKDDATGAWRLSAPVQNPIAGAAVIDRSGALIALVPFETNPGKLIAGVMPEMSRDVMPISQIRAFLAEAAPQPHQQNGARTMGEIAALGSGALYPIYCAP